MTRARKPTAIERRRGSVAIEYALILPLLLMFVLGIIDFSRYMWTYTTLSRGVEAAARCAAINAPGCGSESEIKIYAVSQAFGLAINAGAFKVTVEDCGVQVEGSYDFTFTIPALIAFTPLGTITIKATACYPSVAASAGSGS